MREVFVHQDYTRVGLCQSILNTAGIPNFIRNQYTNNTMTEMPSGLFFPALCVVHDRDYDRAIQVLRELYFAPTVQTADWPCPKCGEEVPGTFELCWNCNASRPDQARDSEGARNV